jgi:ribulose-phosphate 3-epimerase
MSIVIPAVLVPSRKVLDETLTRLDGLYDLVQVDIVDGRFVGPATWPYSEPAELSVLEPDGQFPYLGHFKFEVDLMVENPEATVGKWVEAGAAKILVHMESVRNMQHIVDELRENYGHEKGFAPDLLSLGVALNIDTDTAVIEPYIDSIDYVQFMGIAKIGVQGQPFDTRVLRKIEAFKKAHPDMPIQVDGGVSLTTAPDLLSVGVTNLCVGSALLKTPDLIATMHAFEAVAEQYGRYR